MVRIVINLLDRRSQPSCLLLALLGTLYFSMAVTVNATKSTWIQQHTFGCGQKRWSAFQSPTSANSTFTPYSQPYPFSAFSRSEEDPQQDRNSWRCPSNLQAGARQGAEELLFYPFGQNRPQNLGEEAEDSCKLMLLDEKIFERVLHHAAADESRVNQQVLSDNCLKVLNSAEFRQKRTLAIAAEKNL